MNTPTSRPTGGTTRTQPRTERLIQLVLRMYDVQDALTARMERTWHRNPEFTQLAVRVGVLEARITRAMIAHHEARIDESLAGYDAERAA